VAPGKSLELRDLNRTVFPALYPNYFEVWTPEAQLAGFIAKFTPEVAVLAKAVLAGMQARFPSPIQMVYDNYNFLVIGSCPTERPSEAMFSTALSMRGVSLCFLQAGPKLSDPPKLPRGSGKQARHIRTR
jgi:hypothetical protein